MRKEFIVIGAMLILLAAVISGCGRKDNSSIKDTNNSTTISKNNTNQTGHPDSYKIFLLQFYCEYNQYNNWHL